MRAFWRRLVTLLHRDRLDRDLEEEMRAHLEMSAEEQRENGMPPDEARYAAQRRFGNPTLLQETSRDMWGWRAVEEFARDVRFALRMMRKSVGITAAVVFSFALGIAVNAVAYYIFEQNFRPYLPYPDSSRLVIIGTHHPRGSSEQPTANSQRQDFEDWSARSQCFQTLASVGLTFLPYRTNGSAKNVTAEEVSPSFFDVLAVKPLLGRVFRAEEDTEGRDAVAVLSYRSWTQEFAARPDALGAGIWLGGRRRTIIGVMPAGFRDSGGELHPNLWIPLSSSAWTGEVVARLRPGVGLAQAQAEAEALGSRTPGVQVKVIDMQSRLAGKLPRSVAWMLFGVIAAVFAVACLNVAGLLLARGSHRFRELSLRAALGASRFRLMRQLLTESLLMSLLGCVAGVFLARLGSALLSLAWPDTLPQISVNWRVLTVSAMVAVAAAILSSLGPALAVSHGSSNLQKLDGHHASPTRRRRSFSRWLVGVEAALSLILLTIPGILLKLQALTTPMPRFRTEELLLMRVSPWKQEAQSPEKRVEFYAGILNAVRQGPGIRYAALTSSLGPPNQSFPAEIHPAGQNPARRVPVRFNRVSPEYLQTMSLPLLAGRFFTPQDGPASEKVVVISQSLARSYWGERSPLGDTLVIDRERLAIIGVAADSREYGAGGQEYFEVLVPHLQNRDGARFVVMRTQGPSEAFKAVPAKMIAAIDPDQPVEVFTAGGILKQELASIRAIIGLFGIFAAGALLVSGIGIHAVASYSASERTREIGIRMALGGRKGRVVWEVLREGAVTTALGIIAGFWAAVLGSVGLLRLVGPEISAGQAWLWALQVAAGIAGLAVLTALGAYYGPTRRAAAAEPADTLRCE